MECRQDNPLRKESVMSSEKTVSKELPIERVYPEDLHTHFVSNLLAQHQPDSFTLSFFEIWPPAITGDTPEEKQRQMDAIDFIEAKCVARVVLTPARMKEFVGIMSENLRNYENMMRKQSESHQK